MSSPSPSSAASAFSTRVSDDSMSVATSATGTCMRVPGRGGPRMSLIGLRSMIDSDCAQPTDERSTRNRPDTTDTLAPISFHLAMA